MLFSRILANKSTFHSDYLQENIANLLDRTFNIPNYFGMYTYQVSEEHVARPDLLSYDLYGDDMYGDILCKLNGISNPYELNEGMMIIIPQLADIDEFTVRPSDAWKETTSVPTDTGTIEYVKQLAKNIDKSSGKSSRKIGPKKPNEKRKPNEALLNDRRFNIDPLSKIVIY